jgi:uncharacterized membrane protein
LAFEEIVDVISKVVEAVGILVILAGISWAVITYLRKAQEDSTPPAYTAFRRSLGRAILLGLEFLVAADIIRTVATELTFRSLGLLAIMIAIRTFLSVEIEMEIEGRWPWQANRTRPGLQTGRAEGE